MEDTSPKNLISVIESKLKKRPALLTAVGNIAQTIEETGMSLEDCTLLARMTSEELSLLSDEIPEIALLFRLKRVQYKEKLLKVLHTQATANKDVKIAMYLLEANFSDEYSPVGKKEAAKIKSKENGSELEKLMQRVRTLAPQSPVIEENTIGEVEEEVGATNYDDVTKLVHG